MPVAMRLVVLLAALFICVHGASVPADRKAVKMSAPSAKVLKTLKLKLPEISRQYDIHYMGRRACDMVNNERARYGLPRLWYSGTLTDRSVAHSQWMYTYYSFSHQNIGGVWFYVYDLQRGFNHIMRGNGENIALSVHRSVDVAGDFHWQWVTSPPHYQNMLNRGHTHCGTGFAWDARTGQWWATQMFGRGSFANEFNGQTPA